MDPALRRAIQLAIEAVGIVGLPAPVYFAKATKIALTIIIGEHRPPVPVDGTTLWAGIQRLDDEAWRRNQPAWPVRPVK